MIIFLETFTFVTLFVIAVYHMWRILHAKKPSSAGLLYIAIFIVYGMPLLYRYIIPVEHTYAFASALANPEVRVKYNLVLLVGVFLLWLTSIRGPAGRAEEFSWHLADIELARVQGLSWLCWPGLLLPILIVLLLAPEKNAYLIYAGAVPRGIFFSPFGSFVYALVQYAARFALACYLFIRFSQYYLKGRSWTASSYLATFLMLINCYLDGKRSILLLLLIGLGFFHLLHKGSKKVLLITVPVALIFFFLYIGFGKAPGVATQSEAGYVGYIRGDLSRDHTLSWTIAESELTHNNIMPHRGNSFIWLVTAYIPRRILTSKGWTTPQYFTSAVYGRDVVEWVRNFRWGYGVGYFEEFLLNFGYLGLLLFIPLGLLVRGLDHLIYMRSPMYAIMWVPMLYNVMFASSAALSMYVTLIIPTLLVFWFVLRKRRYGEEIDYLS